MLVIYVDGACEPCNPNGVASWGFLIYERNDKDRIIGPIHRDHGIVGEGEGMSNNVAEYSALIAALEYLLEYGEEIPRKEKILVRSDSQLLIQQMQGNWRVREGLYVKYYYEADKLRNKFKMNMQFEWIPREANEEADRLSRRAYDDYMKDKARKIKAEGSRRLEDFT